MENLKEYDIFMQRIIRQIPSIVEQFTDLDIDTKSGEKDLVTQVDKAVEKFITDNILENFPTHTILGEETYEKGKIYPKDNLWVIDPIDGTTNFVKQRDLFGTIVSYFRDGEPTLAYIYDIKRDILCHCVAGEGVYLNDKKVEPLNDFKLKEVLVSTDVSRMYLYEKEFFGRLVEKSFGLRGHGSCAIDGLKVIAGQIGAYINYSSGPWDFSAFMLISKELNLKFTKFDSSELTLDEYSGFILCNSSVYDEIIKIR